MPVIASSVDDAVAAIPDGAMVVVPRESSGVPMEATRALIRRGVKRLHLVALPTSTMQADMLIGAGCVETLETSAVSLGEFGPAPRFTAAILGRTIAMKDATCPALRGPWRASNRTRTRRGSAGLGERVRSPTRESSSLRSVAGSFHGALLYCTRPTGRINLAGRSRNS